MFQRKVSYPESSFIVLDLTILQDNQLIDRICTAKAQNDATSHPRP